MMAEKVSRPSPRRKSEYGKFKIRLANALSLRDVMTLATYFGLTKADTDNIKRSENPGLDLVWNLEFEDVLSDNDISQLVEGLRECNLAGVVEKIQTQSPITLSSPPISEETAPCLEEITFIRKEDTPEQQRSTILRLKNASVNQTSVTRLTLSKAFLKAEHDEIILVGGLRMSPLASIEELKIITEKGQEFTEQEMMEVITFCHGCRRMRKLLFIDSILPLSVNLFSSIKTLEQLQVAWRFTNYEYHLNEVSGIWDLMFCGSSTFTGESQRKLAKILSTEVILKQSEGNLINLCNKILLLENASKYKIPVSCLVLEKLLFNADQNEIIMTSGARVASLPTLEELVVISEKEKEFSQDEVLGVLKYAQSCHSMEKLTFNGCLMPFSFDVMSLSSVYHSQELSVFWQEMDKEFRLDMSSGHWTLDDSQTILGLAMEGKQSLSRMCQQDIYLGRTESKDFQRSMILLLQIASRYDIPIHGLRLEWSYRGFDGDNIRLESGLSLSSLSSVEKISINGDVDQELSEEDVTGLLNFGLKSTRFKALRFFNCKLPLSINPALITEEAKRMNVKVISSNKARHLTMENGYWKVPGDIETITMMCSGPVVIDNVTSESVQRSIIELLVKASDYEIPIFRLTLSFSVDKIDEDGFNIILKSGLLLPNISSVERMYIQTVTGRELNEEVSELFHYLQQNTRLKELSLLNCVLPSTMLLGPSAATLRSRNVKVFWIPDFGKRDQYYRLDLLFGQWEKEGSW